MNFFKTLFILTAVVSSCVVVEGARQHPKEIMLHKAVPKDNEEHRILVDKGTNGKEKTPTAIDRTEDGDKDLLMHPTDLVGTIAKDTAYITAKNETKIPESLLIAMNGVSSLDDFLRRFVESDPEDFLENNNGPAFVAGSRSGVLNRKGLAGANSPQITPFAGCKPQKSVVKIDPPDDGGVFLWPPCVYLSRCGGCCTSEMMTCHPTATSNVNVTVLQARYTGPQSSRFNNEGVRIVTMEQHDSCACRCKELPEDCTARQEYRDNQCRCVCSNVNEASRCQQQENKLWDSHDCVCKCRNTKECSSGFFFDIKTCRCEVLRLFRLSRIFTPSLGGNETEEAKNRNENLSVSWGNKHEQRGSA